MLRFPLWQLLRSSCAFSNISWRETLIALSVRFTLRKIEYSCEWKRGLADEVIRFRAVLTASARWTSLLWRGRQRRRQRLARHWWRRSFHWLVRTKCSYWLVSQKMSRLEVLLVERLEERRQALHAESRGLGTGKYAAKGAHPSRDGPRCKSVESGQTLETLGLHRVGLTPGCLLRPWNSERRRIPRACLGQSCVCGIVCVCQEVSRKSCADSFCDRCSRVGNRVNAFVTTDRVPEGTRRIWRWTVICFFQRCSGREHPMGKCVTKWWYH